MPADGIPTTAHLAFDTLRCHTHSSAGLLLPFPALQPVLLPFWFDGLVVFDDHYTLRADIMPVGLYSPGTQFLFSL